MCTIITMIYKDLRTDKMAVTGKDEGGRMKDENEGSGFLVCEMLCGWKIKELQGLHGEGWRWKDEGWKKNIIYNSSLPKEVVVQFEK